MASLAARLVELDGRIWLEVFQVGRKICRRKAVKKLSVALSESKWSLALSRREYKYQGHPLRFRNFSAPARLARPFHARNGALSPCPRITSHLAASIIKAYITRICHFFAAIFFVLRSDIVVKETSTLHFHFRIGNSISWHRLALL